MELRQSYNNNQTSNSIINSKLLFQQQPRQTTPNDIEKSILKKEELQKRIQENQKLIQMLQQKLPTKHATPINEYKKHFAAKKIQKYFKVWIKVKQTKLSKQLKISNTKSIISIKDLTENKTLVKRITAIQKRFRKRKQLRFEAKIQFYYTREFEAILLDIFHPTKVEEARKSILRYIEGNSYHSNSSLINLLNEYTEKYLSFNLSFPVMVELRNRNFTLLSKCLEQIAFLSRDTNLESKERFDKYYYTIEDKQKAREELDSQLKDVESKIQGSWYVDDLEARDVVAEIDAFLGYDDFFKDVLYK